MENLNLPFEYLNFRIGYTISELEGRFFTKATDSIELIQNEDFGWEMNIDHLILKFNCILRYLQDHSNQSNIESRKESTKETIATCNRCMKDVSKFFLGGLEGSKEKPEDLPARHNLTETKKKKFPTKNSSGMVEAFAPIISHHQAADIYDIIQGIADDTGNTQALVQLYSYLTQRYLGDLKHSISRCLQLNDGQVDPFFSLGETLGKIAWAPNFMCDHERIAYFSTELIPKFTTSLYNCSRIRPFINTFPTAFIYKKNNSICGDALSFSKTLSKQFKKLKDTPLPSNRHKYKDIPTNLNGYIDATKKGVEIYGQNLSELRPLHKRMLLMLMLENCPVSAEDFSILNEPWQNSCGDLAEKANKRISAEVTKLSKDLARYLNIENRTDLVIRTHGSDREARYRLNWGRIDARFNPVFAYRANFLT